MPALSALTEAYSQHHPSVAFDLRGGGSTLGEQWIAAKEYDMVISTLMVSSNPVSSNPVSSNPAQVVSPVADGAAPLSTAMDVGAVEPTPGATPGAAPGGTDAMVRSPMALDGLAIVVHPANKVKGLTLLQLRDLYSGHILNWREVGGREDSVLLISREDGSGARAFFETQVMGETGVSLTAIVMPTHEDVVRYVAAHPQALGYVSRGYVSNILTGAEADPAVRVLSVDGVYPLIENLRDRSYPFVYPLHLITRRDSNPRVIHFREFVLSPAGQEIVSRYHAPIR